MGRPRRVPLLFSPNLFPSQTAHEVMAFPDPLLKACVYCEWPLTKLPAVSLVLCFVFPQGPPPHPPSFPPSLPTSAPLTPNHTACVSIHHTWSLPPLFFPLFPWEVFEQWATYYYVSGRARILIKVGKESRFHNGKSNLSLQYQTPIRLWAEQSNSTCIASCTLTENSIHTVMELIKAHPCPVKLSLQRRNLAS